MLMSCNRSCLQVQICVSKQEEIRRSDYITFSKDSLMDFLQGQLVTGLKRVALHWQV